MIYNSRKYPKSLFIEKSSNLINKMMLRGCLVIYKKNMVQYIGKFSGSKLKNSILINTNWEFAETIEPIEIDDIKYISAIQY